MSKHITNTERTSLIIWLHENKCRIDGKLNYREVSEQLFAKFGINASDGTVRRYAEEVGIELAPIRRAKTATITTLEQRVIAIERFLKSWTAGSQLEFKVNEGGEDE